MFDYLLGKNKNAPLVSVDIGSDSIKVMQLDLTSKKPRLVALGSAKTPLGAFNNNVVVRKDEVADKIRSVFEQNEIKVKKVATVLPGPCAFIKKISIPYCDTKTLEKNITYEAANYIPHDMDALQLDYQVIRKEEGGKMDILLVAVKNEIVQSYRDVILRAGLEPVVLDVDYFAIENMFELNYEDYLDKTVAVVNIGSRFTSVNIIQKGESIFTGDVGVGGKLYTDALVNALNIKHSEAESFKLTKQMEGVDLNVAEEVFDKTTEHVSSELQRQIGFFWNAAAADSAIDVIFLMGGASQTTGLAEAISEKTGTRCLKADVFSNVVCSDSFDRDYLDEIGLSMAVSVGLSRRRLGDKEQLRN